MNFKSEILMSMLLAIIISLILGKFIIKILRKNILVKKSEMMGPNHIIQKPVHRLWEVLYLSYLH